VKTFTVAGAAGVDAVVEHLLDRINYADGPYPMTHMLGDGMLISCGDGGMQARPPARPCLVPPPAGGRTGPVAVPPSSRQD
jgi:hypothetical protein